MKDETNTEKSWKEIKQKIQETAEESVLDKKKISKKNEVNNCYDQDSEAAILQKNMARIKWINITIERDRQDYEIKRNGANAMYRGKKNEYVY